MEKTEEKAAVIPWFKYDYIGVAGCTKYQDRYKNTSAELYEYGCTSARWGFDFPNPFKDELYRVVKKAPCNISSASDFYLAMNHYRNVKTAYMLGSERALFMEDDIAFLKDKGLFAEIMSSVPEDADFAFYDWRPRRRYDAEVLGARAQRGKHWVEANDVTVLYFSMIAMSRKGMEYIIRNIEDGAFGSGMYDIDTVFRPGMSDGLRTYVAFPHAAMQVNTGSSVHAKNKPYMGTVVENDYFVRGDSVKAASNKSNDPVDAVFVIGTGSKNSNEELRYALRSLDKNCKFIRDVYICGECPSWVDKSTVRHLQWPDRFTHAKDANIIDKLRHACEMPGIANRILFCSDDQFQTRACSWNDFSPRWLRKYDPGDTYYADRNRIWHKRLRKTLERDRIRRGESGLDQGEVYFWEPHIWMPMSRDRFMEYSKWCGYENRDDTIIASGYYNFVGERGTESFDHVFLKSGADLSNLPTHVAYNDSSYGVAMSILRRMFPNPSRFESGRKDVSQDAPQIRKYEWNARGAADTNDQIFSSRVADVRKGIMSDEKFKPMYADVAKAEELRLTRYHGWRVVWEDIIGRFERRAPEEALSMEAADILSGYDMRNGIMSSLRSRSDE